MELSKEKHEASLAQLRDEVILWNQQADGAHAYEVLPGGLGKFLFYKKNQGSEEKTQIATIHLTGAGGTMQQNTNAPKDLQVLKRSAWHMCIMLNDSNPTGNYTLKFTGPDAEEIKAHVHERLEQEQLTSKFTFVGGDAQSVRPNVLGQPASSAASASGSGSREFLEGSQGSFGDDSLMNSQRDNYRIS
jgi:hypothetical protein